eukprot:9217-Prorocentrum_minimum.AAC.4
MREQIPVAFAKRRSSLFVYRISGGTRSKTNASCPALLAQGEAVIGSLDLFYGGSISPDNKIVRGARDSPAGLENSPLGVGNSPLGVGNSPLGVGWGQLSTRREHTWPTCVWRRGRSAAESQRRFLAGHTHKRLP